LGALVVCRVDRYTAVVIALLVAKASSPWLDVLAGIFLVARIAQSTLHIGPKQTELVH
jgi:uncharacterized MAPEG superfamily protein